MCNQNMKTKKKFIYRSAACVVAMLLVSFSCILVSAAAVDVTPLTTAITDFGTTLQSFGYPIFFVVLVIGAICLMVGQQGRAMGKVIMFSGAIGVAVVSFAPSIVTFMQGILSATTGGGMPA